MKFRFLCLFSVFSIFCYSFAPALTNKEEEHLLRDFLWSKFVSLPKENRPKIGVTLSAGGIRGFSHIGVLEVLKENSVPIDYMSGASMGCIVSAMYSAGVSFERMRELAAKPNLSYLSKDLSLIGVMRYVFGNRLFSSKNFQDFISNEIGAVYYEDLAIPLTCASADIKTGERVIFDSGPVALGVRASMNLPGIFAPVEYRQRYLVDGGVVDYIPVDLAREMGAGWVLAVLALPDYSKTVPTTILGYIVRSGDIRGALITENSEKNADFLLGVRVGDLNFYMRNEAAKAVDLGAKTAYEEIDDIKNNL
ncbi:MAG: patatin-like phospholipase family protein, partial [Elusimicrobiota bacterium]|nr:patatin-like phospholipase family protein [Elusimicrobiota bacterium]